MGGPLWWLSGQRALLLPDDPSLNPAEGSSFSVKFVFEKLFKKGHSVPPFSFLFSIFSLN